MSVFIPSKTPPTSTARIRRKQFMRQLDRPFVWPQPGSAPRPFGPGATTVDGRPMTPTKAGSSTSRIRANQQARFKKKYKLAGSTGPVTQHPDF